MLSPSDTEVFITLAFLYECKVTDSQYQPIVCDRNGARDHKKAKGAGWLCFPWKHKDECYVDGQVSLVQCLIKAKKCGFQKLNQVVILFVSI